MTTEGRWFDSQLGEQSWRVYERSDWADHAGTDWLSRIMDVRLSDDFHAKQGRSTGRWVLRGTGHDFSVYLKRHYELPRVHGVMAELKLGETWSPALHEMRNLQWAASQNLRVPAVVAAGQAVGAGCRLQSFLVIEELVGMKALHQAIPLAEQRLSPEAFKAWKRGLTEELARLALVLHEQSAFHKDLYLCHFYVAEDDTWHVPTMWRGRVAMIDFHRLGHHRWSWPNWLLKDLAALLFSSHTEGVDDDDRAWFWQSYQRQHGFRWWHGLLAAAIRLKGRRYLRHNEKAKQATTLRKSA